MAARADMDSDDGINEINVTPLVDVMLVLLVIFLVASVYIVKDAVELELPKAASATEAPETTISVEHPGDHRRRSPRLPRRRHRSHRSRAHPRSRAVRAQREAQGIDARSRVAAR
jgi:hypothetical protein